MNNKAEYWIDMADYDLETARTMLIGKRYLYVGFMCHLTIEKALKAVISNGDEEATPPKIHDLVKLSKQGSVYDVMDDKQKDFLEVLLPLNIEARYSSYKEKLSTELTNERCTGILEETEELLCWIKQQL